jgi:hypothetical protein
MRLILSLQQLLSDWALIKKMCASSFILLFLRVLKIMHKNAEELGETVKNLVVYFTIPMPTEKDSNFS